MIEGRVKKAEKKEGESDRKTTKRETVGLTGVGLVEKRKERRDEKKKRNWRTIVVREKRLRTRINRN